MSANISEFGGRLSMAYNGLSPWHGLGRKLSPEAMVSVEQALHEGNVHWTVSKVPTYFYPIGSDKLTQSKLGFSILREDGAELGNVGPRYAPVQNAEAFAVLQPSLEKAGVTVRTVGAIGKGERVWMLGRLGEGKEIRRGETVLPNFLIMNAHDGSLGVIGKLTPIDVVCQNTLNAALADKAKSTFNIRHTASAEERLKEAERLVSVLTGAWTETVEVYKEMAETAIDNEAVRQAIELLMPIPGDASDLMKDRTTKARLNVASLFKGGVGANLRGDTAWGLYNAFTEYVDHVVPAEVANRSKSVGAIRRAMVSTMFGSGNDLKAKALQVTRAMVAA